MISQDDIDLCCEAEETVGLDMLERFAELVRAGVPSREASRETGEIPAK